MPNIINIYKNSRDPSGRIISNLAHTPFQLDGELLASLEGFHQGIKFENLQERRHVFGLWGDEAKQAGKKMNKLGVKCYFWGNKIIQRDSPQYYGVYHRALMAKFTQDPVARGALVATGDALFKHAGGRIQMTFEEYQNNHVCQSLYTIRKILAGGVDQHLARALTELELSRAKMSAQLESLDTAIRILRPLCKS